jgi:cysteine-rich repeat protein
MPLCDAGTKSCNANAFHGYWEGKTSQSLPVAFRVNVDGSVSDLQMGLRLSLAGATCTATFAGKATSLMDAVFTTTVSASGISVAPAVTGTFSSPTAMGGTYAGYSGGYFIVCGSTLSLGTGSLLSAGTFAAAPTSVCGNGIVEKGEECDGTVPPCDSNCQRTPVCGDGLVDLPETCDDGNTSDGDGCSAACKKETKRISYPTDLPLLNQPVAARDYVLVDVAGVTPGTPYTVSTRDAVRDLDLYVWDDPAGTKKLCSGTTLSGNESCKATPTSDTLHVTVANFATSAGSFTLDVVAAPAP